MSGLRTALGLFTVTPFRRSDPLTRLDAIAAIRCFPLIGAALGAVAGLPMAAVLHWVPDTLVLGAVFAVLALALLTRGLHLDGLADTVDGLGSGAPAERALKIMRRPDIGPFGVLAIVFVVLVDVAALASLTDRTWQPVAGLAVAAATGRTAVVAAAHRRVPSARPTGFGAYVAGSQPTPVVVAWLVVVLAFGAGMAAAVDASVVGWLVAQVVALVATAGVQMHAVRRLGGVTGDVFGALVEIGTAMTLAGLAFA